MAKGAQNVHVLELTDGSMLEIPAIPDQAELSVVQFADFITVSEVASQANTPGVRSWLLGGGIAVVLLCGFVLVAGALIVFLVVRSRKQKTEA
ncbi:MAG: hypothetical protein JXB38_06020 [Anaerolineales bacterium]|nr:hypothetical protein [Anaerolineales bacterium]